MFPISSSTSISPTVSPLTTFSIFGGTPYLPVTDVRSSEVIRARVTAIRPTGFQVSVPGETDERLVPVQDVQARVTLPWKPTALHHALIVLRRRDNNKDFYVDDLRVRRNYVIALLRCLSELGHWRENCGEEPMHMYYTEFDWLPDNEIESVLPEDGLPEGLHIEDYDDTPAAASFTQTEFHDWIWEGRHDCDIAFLSCTCGARPYVAAARKQSPISLCLSFTITMLT